MTEGIIIVDKPDGMTSHDVVAKVRKKFKMQRVGHAGTLDPLATGVLVLLLGKATKLFSKFVDFDKAYRATMILGMKTMGVLWFVTRFGTQKNCMRDYMINMGLALWK